MSSGGASAGESTSDADPEPNGGWRVCFTRRDLPGPAAPRPFAEQLSADLGSWLDAVDIPDGTPFLLSPLFTLDGFFHGPQMLMAPPNTQAGYARDIARFMTFLSSAPGGKSWRDATEDDHLAYLTWRRRDPAGPLVAGSTWDREVAAINQFYDWAVRHGHLVDIPVPQRQRRRAPVEAGRPTSRSVPVGTTPATYSHDAARERVQWLPPPAYRRWRDVGLRGYTGEGLPNPGFRGRWAERNATFADLMVRTGLRLTEQASLTVLEVPTRPQLGGYLRFWLPAAIAKGGSARWVYVPDSLVRELATYVTVDRADVIAQAPTRTAARCSPSATGARTAAKAASNCVSTRATCSSAFTTIPFTRSRGKR